MCAAVKLVDDSLATRVWRSECRPTPCFVLGEAGPLRMALCRMVAWAEMSARVYRPAMADRSKSGIHGRITLDRGGEAVSLPFGAGHRMKLLMLLTRTDSFCSPKATLTQQTDNVFLFSFSCCSSSPSALNSIFPLCDASSAKNSRDAAAASLEHSGQESAAELPLGAAGTGGGPATASQGKGEDQPGSRQDNHGEADEEDALAASFAAQDADGSMSGDPPEAPAPSSKRSAPCGTQLASWLLFAIRDGCFTLVFDLGFWPSLIVRISLRREMLGSASWGVSYRRKSEW